MFQVIETEETREARGKNSSIKHGKTRREGGQLKNLGVLIRIMSFSYSSVDAGHSIYLLQLGREERIVYGLRVEETSVWTLAVSQRVSIFSICGFPLILRPKHKAGTPCLFLTSKQYYLPAFRVYKHPYIYFLVMLFLISIGQPLPQQRRKRGTALSRLPHATPNNSYS